MLMPIELKVEAALYPEAYGLRINEIQFRVKYSYERTHMLLRSLSNKGAVLRKKEGKTVKFSINNSSSYAFLGFTYYTSEQLWSLNERNNDVAIALREFMEVDDIRCGVLMNDDPKNLEVVVVSDDGVNIKKLARKISKSYNVKIKTTISNSISKRREIKRDVVLKGLEYYFKNIYGNGLNDTCNHLGNFGNFDGN